MIAFVLLYIPKLIITITVIVLVYYGIKIFSRYLLPLLIDKGIKNMQQKMQDQQSRNQPPSRPEGEVTIEGQPQYKKNQNRDNSEYIDFEEVD
jgi:hypothetical protein